MLQTYICFNCNGLFRFVEEVDEVEILRAPKEIEYKYICKPCQKLKEKEISIRPADVYRYDEWKANLLAKEMDEK